MEDDTFRDVIVRVIGAVVKEPEVQKLAGSAKVFAFGASDSDINWYIDATAEPLFSEGTPERRDVRVTMTKDDWIQALQGKLSPTQALLRKKIKLEGSMMVMTSLSMDALTRVYNRELGPA